MNTKLFQKLVILTPVLTTLFVTDQLLDPFNVGKFAVLVTLTALILLTFSFHKKNYLGTSIDKALIFLLFCFVFSQVIVAIFNHQNFYRATLGIWGRNNGILSYLGLSIVLFFSYVLVKQGGDLRLVKALSYLGIFESVYGLMQWQHADFFQFSFIGSPVFLTLGNEDFSSVFLVLGIIATIYLMTFHKSDVQKFALTCGALFQAIIMLEMNTAQSKIGLGLSLSIYTLFNLNNFVKRSQRHFYSAILIGIVGIFSLTVGFLGQGPLSFISHNLSSLYSRYLHWVAGWKMFLSKPFFGVGIDSYGDYQPFYRILDKNGVPDTYSNNAHNLIVQFLATGGLLLALSFLAIYVFSLSRLFALIKNSEVTKACKSFYCSLFLIFTLNVLIGIDNLGLIVWFYALIGSLIAMSVSRQTNSDTTKKSKQLSVKKFSFLSMLSLSLGAALLILSFFPWKNVYMEAQLQNLFVKTNQQGVNSDLMTKIDQRGRSIVDSETRMLAIKFLYEANQNLLAYNLSKDTSDKFPRSLRALEAMYQYDVKFGNIEKAISIKKKLIGLDPLNQEFKKDLDSLVKNK